MIAFGNIGKTGYLDRLYVHPDYLRKGIASKLVEDLEAYAKKHDCHVINVTSSITSKPFFESKGYAVIEEQINEVTFDLSPRAFFQLNPQQTELLYGEGIKALDVQPNETIVDAYCGDGTIG